MVLRGTWSVTWSRTARWWKTRLGHCRYMFVCCILCSCVAAQLQQPAAKNGEKCTRCDTFCDATYYNAVHMIQHTDCCDILSCCVCWRICTNNQKNKKISWPANSSILLQGKPFPTRRTWWGDWGAPKKHKPMLISLTWANHTTTSCCCCCCCCCERTVMVLDAAMDAAAVWYRMGFGKLIGIRCLHLVQGCWIPIYFLWNYDQGTHPPAVRCSLSGRVFGYFINCRDDRYLLQQVCSTALAFFVVAPRHTAHTYAPRWYSSQYVMCMSYDILQIIYIIQISIF